MDTIKELEEISKIMKKTIDLEKSPRINKNYKIINLVIDWFSYSEVWEKFWISRQAVHEVLKNSKKIFLK